LSEIGIGSNVPDCYNTDVREKVVSMIRNNTFGEVFQAEFVKNYLKIDLLEIKRKSYLEESGKFICDCSILVSYGSHPPSEIDIRYFISSKGKSETLIEVQYPDTSQFETIMSQWFNSEWGPGD
jgi:hypothetical protein